MTACDLYQLFVGENAFPRHDFLYEIDYMEARRLMCGFADRHRHTWSAVRWATFNIMSATADMKKAGITSPAALLPLPWDKPTGPTKQEVSSAMKELMAVRRQVLNSKPKG